MRRAVEVWPGNSSKPLSQALPLALLAWVAFRTQGHFNIWELKATGRMTSSRASARRLWPPEVAYQAQVGDHHLHFVARSSLVPQERDKHWRRRIFGV